MQVEQVDFMSVPTQDITRAVGWYRDVLGLAESEFSAGEIETPNLTLSFWKPEEQGEPFVPNENGVALRVADVEAGMYVPPLLEALRLAEVTHDARNNRMRAL